MTAMPLSSPKSVVPRFMIQPPPQTHAAIGKYPTVAKMPAKISQEPNLARSAMAPEIRATVMIAKVAPYATPRRATFASGPSDSAERPKSANGLPANCVGLSTALIE